MKLKRSDASNAKRVEAAQCKKKKIIKEDVKIGCGTNHREKMCNMFTKRGRHTYLNIFKRFSPLPTHTLVLVSTSFHKMQQKTDMIIYVCVYVCICVERERKRMIMNVVYISQVSICFV